MTPFRWLIAAVCVVAIALVWVLMAPESAATRVGREGLWLGTVRKGDLSIEVRGPGVLVPKEFRWISAETAARIESISVRAGASVEADSVILRLSNPTLVDQKSAADAQLLAAEAELAAQQARLESEDLDRQAEVASAEAEYEQAKLQSEAQSRALALGVTSRVQQHMSEVVTQSQNKRLSILRRRASAHLAASAAELAAARARIQHARGTASLLASQVAALEVKAGIAGVLQEVVVETGQQVSAGANLARVAKQGSLMAQLRVDETQINGVETGQGVTVSLGNDQFVGRVERIDPAVRSGTVLVDAALDGDLPGSARPDVNVDGRISVDLLRDVLFVERPANVRSGTSAAIFRITPDGRRAERIMATLGDGSSSMIEIKNGLREGDRVVLSDTSAWANHAYVELD